jgi:RNA polymerase sigma-70 factor (ECF subfamily)
MVDQELSSLSDEALVALCILRGETDDRPFTILFQRHYRGVWRTCHYFLRNVQETEDLTQEVFFRAFRSLATFEGRAAFKTWLTRIAVNACKNELRARGRRPHLVEDALEEMEERSELIALVGGHPEKATDADSLSAAFGCMRPEDVDVIHLRAIEGRPYTEIAATLGISLSAAKMRVQRAQLALQRALQSQSEGGLS